MIMSYRVSESVDMAQDGTIAYLWFPTFRSDPRPITTGRVRRPESLSDSHLTVKLNPHARLVPEISKLSWRLGLFRCRREFTTAGVRITSDVSGHQLKRQDLWEYNANEGQMWKGAATMK